jgi:membrane-bound lytic murein transglycosylase B
MRRANRGLYAGLSLGLALACATTPHPNPPAPAVAAPPVVAAKPAPAPPSASRPDPLALEERVLDAKGWSWLVAKLVADGVPRERATRAFADARMPPFDGLFFNPDPAEPRSMYRAVLQRRSIAQARACRDEYASAFDGAEARTGVPAEVVAAILHVETRCGRNTGESLVLYGLARLAMANEPDNLERNLDRRAAPGGSLDPALEQRVRARAATLEGLFYPEVRGVFELAQLWGRDPLSLRGSASGAFGFPQFLPTSYLRFGADGNGDGRVDLYDVDDAATSAAWFLVSHGWQGRLERGAQRRVLWHYNRSDAYIDAVLGLAAEIGPGPARASVPVVEAAH